MVQFECATRSLTRFFCLLFRKRKRAKILFHHYQDFCQQIISIGAPYYPGPPGHPSAERCHTHPLCPSSRPRAKTGNGTPTPHVSLWGPP
jgi:hypothetical protein